MSWVKDGGMCGFLDTRRDGEHCSSQSKAEQGLISRISVQFSQNFLPMSGALKYLHSYRRKKSREIFSSG